MGTQLNGNHTTQCMMYEENCHCLQKAIKVKVYSVLDITLLNSQKIGLEVFALN